MRTHESRTNEFEPTECTLSKLTKPVVAEWSAVHIDTRMRSATTDRMPVVKVHSKQVQLVLSTSCRKTQDARCQARQMVSSCSSTVDSGTMERNRWWKVIRHVPDKPVGAAWLQDESQTVRTRHEMARATMEVVEPDDTEHSVHLIQHIVMRKDSIRWAFDTNLSHRKLK